MFVVGGHLAPRRRGNREWSHPGLLEVRTVGRTVSLIVEIFTRTAAGAGSFVRSAESSIGELAGGAFPAKPF
jgi:hypothetical protein